MLKRVKRIPLDSHLDIVKLRKEYTAYFNKTDPTTIDSYRELKLEDDEVSKFQSSKHTGNETGVSTPVEIIKIHKKP